MASFFIKKVSFLNMITHNVHMKSLDQDSALQCVVYAECVSLSRGIPHSKIKIKIRKRLEGGKGQGFLRA